MRRLLWVDGRLSWPPVIAVVFLTASLIAFDFVWRLVNAPFGTFFVWAVALDAAAAILLIVVTALIRRRSTDRRTGTADRA